mgnify:CR=1 FL=1
MARLDEYRDGQGKLPAFAWPGGYPLIYVTNDGGVLCPACANGENGAKPTYEDDSPHSGWQVDAADVHYEGAPEICNHCGAEIESAYGDPNDSPSVGE